MSDWSSVALGQLLTLEYGKALPDRARDGGGAPVFGSNGEVGRHSKPLIEGPGVVVGRKGTAGSVTYVAEDFFPIDTTYYVSIKDARLGTMRYAALLLEAADLPGICAQTGVPGLNRERAYELEVDLPPIPEQSRIVDVVDAADAQVGALKEGVAGLTALLQAARNSLAESRSPLTLRDLAAQGGIQIGPFGSQLHAHEYTDEGTPVVMPQDLVNGAITTSKIKRVPDDVTRRLAKHRLRSGDIVFPRRGDLTKRALVQPEQDGWLCGTGCLRFRARDIEQAARLFEALAGDPTSDWLVENAVGTTMLNLNTEILSKLPVSDVVDHPELADACIAAQFAHRHAISELSELLAFRATLLATLLNREIDIPPSYDTLLEVVA